ncbi:hypothetical protein ACFW04_010499 [Cataglyphis niger]
MVVLNNFLPPQEGIRHEEPNTTVYINDREVGKGTFYITESVVSWIDNNTQQGFSLEYPDISLHAVSREQLRPRQCLYIMVDVKIDLPDMPLVLPSENASENEDADADTSITEVQFVPDNTNNLDLMFQAMTECQALHPDPDMSSFSDEDIYEDAEEDNEGEYDEEVGAGDAPCSSPEQMGTNYTGKEVEEAMDIEAGQFEDAEEDL